ncbi:MAG TPA: acyl-CoA dehydrogenase C-terminal domain-containing protein [Alphaproteobacteria bacterium]
MSHYTAPIKDTRFLLYDVLDWNRLSSLPAFAEATPDLIDAVLEEGGRICADVFAPLNKIGDEIGSTWADRKVTAPPGFKDAYNLYRDGGWTTLSAETEYGGQGLPQTISAIMAEYISSANLAFGLFPGLTQGAINALRLHGTDELKNIYMPPMIAGTWTGTMNLTEPQAGTDLGLLRTKAEPNGDGSYSITGTKIFISCGDHDLAENIIHLVLARMPDAPPGVKGISLFIAPKFMVNADGSLGEQNKLFCGSIEEKMGIHASPTCVMHYEGAKAWLVGEPHKGLKAMFTMMNEARLLVGTQGLGVAEVACQSAFSYARDRLQGRGLNGPVYPEKNADPIIVHPDVRNMLLRSKSLVEGMRALLLDTSFAVDLTHGAATADERQEADEFVQLMTPIVKAMGTDIGFEVAHWAVQVHGGVGYCRDYPVEQFLRDARITQIYEGTNGIQALDLVGRKMATGYGRVLRRFFHPAQKFIDENQNDAGLAELLFPWIKAFGKLQQATVLIAQNSLKDKNEAGAAASDYLKMFGLVVLGFYWLKMAKAAKAKLESDPANKDFYQMKIKTANYFMQRVLPEYESRFRMLASGAKNLMDISEAELYAA